MGTGSVIKAMMRMGLLQCRQSSGKHSKIRVIGAAHRHWAGEPETGWAGTVGVAGFEATQKALAGSPSRASEPLL